LMPFRPQALLDTDVKFTNADKIIGPKLVDGRGQWVYWTGCSGVTSRENGKKENHQESEGKAIVEEGVDVYFTGGQVREGHLDAGNI